MPPADTFDDHARARAPHASAGRRRLVLTLAVIGVYTAVELIAALITGSLALLADAGHMLTDSAALLLSLLALWVAERPATPTMTYGYHRVEVLAAVVNAATLVAISGYIMIEAYQRWADPPPLPGTAMSIVAFGGLLANLVALWLLRPARAESLNLRGAFLHVATDLLGSVGAITAGLLIWLLNWLWADPALSVLIGLLVLFSGGRLLHDTGRVLLEGTPAGMAVDELRAELEALPGVAGIHDLHVWTIGSGMTALTVHLVTSRPHDQKLLNRAHEMLRERFGVQHATVQVETPEDAQGRYCSSHGCPPSRHD